MNSLTERMKKSGFAIPVLASLVAVGDGFVMVMSSYDVIFVCCEVVLVACAGFQWVLYYKTRNLSDVEDILANQQEIWKSPRIDVRIAYIDKNLTNYRYIEAWSLADALSQVRFAGLEPVEVWVKSDATGKLDDWNEVALPDD